MLRSLLRGATLLIALAATSAQARDVAYIIGNSNYDHYSDVPTAGRVGVMARRLESAGFEVTLAEDMTADRLAVLGNSILRDARNADTLVIFMSGHVVSGPSDAWLLGRDADSVNAISAGQSGLSLNALAAIGGRIPGRAILLLADGDGLSDLGYGMKPGYGGVSLPQGVTLVNGPYFRLQQLVRAGLLDADQSMFDLIRASNGELQAHGYVSTVPLFHETPTQLPVLNEAALIEDGYWQAVDTLGTIEAYEAYLDRYPGGDRAGQAREKLFDLRNPDPIQLAQDAEAALGLDRDARRSVQRDLDILGFDPRGIDGIFGPGTRAAIRSWQEANNFEVTGYLDRPQRVVLRQAAQARADQLQREADERRKKAEAEERAFWRQMAKNDTANSYGRYLQRYPDGMFSEEATKRLNAIENAARLQAEREERDAWDRAKASDSIESYERYLSRYPRGNFSDAARQRIAALRNELDQADRLRAAAEAEKAVVSGGAMSLIVETRLAQLGYNPGAIDGKFDDVTRRAIRQYQRAVNVEPTGYVGQRTLVLLLSGRN